MAISSLYNTHAPTIYRYVRFRVETDAQAEDVTSEVFLRMVRELPRYRITGAPFSAWLYRIAYNCLMDMFRWQRHETPEELPEDLPGESSDPLDVLATAQDHEQLRRALQSLSQDYQNVLVLRFVSDVPHNEVAAIMGKSEAAARVLQHRALKALGSALHAIRQGGMR